MRTLGVVATSERAVERADVRGRRALAAFGDEVRERRIELGLSQEAVATAARISRPRYTRVEAAKAPTLTIIEATRIASVLGLDLSVKVYPGGDPLRDAASVARLEALAARVSRPLRFRTEVPLPERDDGFEQRAWDAEVRGAGLRTTFELEMRIRDAQAVERRITLKRRDDPPDRFVLLVAATRHNRRMLADHPRFFRDLPRLRPSTVFRALAAGHHPPTGLILM
jgi:transcriptional regulator with XRE-family HTH domain